MSTKPSGFTSTENRLLSSKLHSGPSNVFSIKPAKISFGASGLSAGLSLETDISSNKIPRLALTTSFSPKLSLTKELASKPSVLSSALKSTIKLGAGNLSHHLGTVRSSSDILRPSKSADIHVRTLPPLSTARGMPTVSLNNTTKESCVPNELSDPDAIFEASSDSNVVVIRDEFLSTLWTGISFPEETRNRALQCWTTKTTDSDELSLLKLSMVDRLASALVSMPNFKFLNPVTNVWVNELQGLSSADPEFILKLSLYAREELNIRTAANFLVAYAAFCESARPFLIKYFGSVVKLPSDWLEIVELGQYFADKKKKYGEIPKALRTVMVKKFANFDAYQLAKYNKEKSRLKKGKKSVKPRSKPRASAMDVDSGSSSEESDNEVNTLKAAATPKTVFTLKRMIRCLHICEPVDHVMPLLGKRYPNTDTEFFNSRLSGSFDKNMAGKRMKLPIPETWETQVSMNGNKAEVWESLLNHRKLPYMALLRNIRNLLRAGISDRHHRMAAERLSDREAVIKSRQLPIRFLSAYEVLRQLQREKEIFDKWKSSPVKRQRRQGGRGGHAPPRQRGKPASNVNQKIASAAMRALAELMPKAPAASLPSIAKSLRKSKNYSEELINDYKKALNTALQVATTYNIQPIRGRTLIFCDMGAKHGIGGANNPMGPCRTAAEAGALLGFMCKSACELCDFFAYDHMDGELYRVESEKGTILDQVTSLKARYENAEAKDSPSVNRNVVLNEMLQLLSAHVAFDTVIWFDGQSANFAENSEVDRCLADIAKTYIETVRATTIFVHVDLSPAGCRKDAQRKVGQSLANQKALSPYLIHLAGFSDAILRFIAERSDDSRLRYIDNIDKKYQLSASAAAQSAKRPRRKRVDVNPVDLYPSSQNAVSSSVPSRSVRIFISSTFRDMHGERDLLTRFVIPQLRLNAAKIGLQIYDVDLRWGITEEEANRSGSLLLCLGEAKRADLFIGILGERYGSRPGLAAVETAAKQFPEISGYGDRSVTELEMRIALGNLSQLRNRAFFYIRDSSELLKKLPAKYATDFQIEDSQSGILLGRLKADLRRSGFSVMDGYPADYGGVVSTTAEGKSCRVSRLEEFGERITRDIWNALTSIAKSIALASSTCESDEGAFEKSLQLHTQRLTYLNSSFVGRAQFCSDIVRRIKVTFESNSPSGVILLNGLPGSGKSAVVAQIIHDASEQHAAVCLYYFADASHTSGTVRELTDHFIQCLLRVFRTMKLSTKELLGLLSNEDRATPPSFGDLMKVVSEVNPGVPLLFVIDSLDSFQSDAAGLSFLPENTESIPENVVLLLSCRSGTLACASVERLLKTATATSARPVALTIEVPQLPVADRSAVVRSILARYGKQLGDSAWDNQMSALTQKRHAGLPAYLALACEELRLFGLYEELSLRVRRLPHTVTQLLGDVLGRLESDHGRSLVEHSCCLLAVAPSGLSEADLRRLIGVAMHLKMEGMRTLEPGLDTLSGIERTIKIAVFCKLVQSLRGFLSSASSSLAINDSNMMEVIEHAYFGIPNPALSGSGFARPTAPVRAKSAALSSPGYEKKSAYCRLIATYYCAKFQNNSDSCSTDELVLKDLPKLLCRAGCFHQLGRLLTSLHYLAARCTSPGSVRHVIADFRSPAAQSEMPSRLQSQMRDDFIENKSVQRIQQFIQRNVASLSLGFPHLLWQSAFNDLDSAIRLAAVKSFDTNIGGLGDLAMIVRVINETDDENAATNVKPVLISKSSKSILCVDVYKEFIAFGSEDTTVTIYRRLSPEFSAAKDGPFRTLTGHAGPITALSFSAPAGSSLKLFTASRDRTLCSWDVMAGNRLNVFSNHQRPITGCAALGRLLATSSTDCTVAVYDVVSSRLLVRIYDACPLNAVALHPAADGRLAVGCWDTAIRLWSATPKESTVPRRVAVFRGHAAPVTAVAFSPCGMYIASGSIDGEIRLFLADHAVQVGVLGGQSGFSITCLRYMENSLVSASSDWTLRVWSRGLGRLIAAYCSGTRPQTGKAKSAVLSSTSADGISCMAVSKDSQLIGIATKSGQLLVLPYADFLKSPPFVPTSHRVDTALSPVLSITFTSSEPRRLVYGCNNGTVRSIDVSSNSLDAASQSAVKKRFDLADSRSAVGSLAAGIRYTACGSADAIIRVYENHPTLKGNSTEVAPSFTLTGHRATVTCLYMEEMQLLSGDMDGTVFVWSMGSRGSTASIVRAHGDGISAIALTKDNIITSGSDTIKAWTLTGEPARTIGSHASLITTLSCVDGCIVSGDCSGVLKIHTWRGVEVTSLKTSAASVVGISINVELNNDGEEQSNDAVDTARTVANWADECEREEIERERASRRLKTPRNRQRNIIVVSANSDGWLRAYKPLEAEVKTLLKGHVDTVTCFAVNVENSERKEVAKSHQVVSTSLDGTCQSWAIQHVDEGVPNVNNVNNTPGEQCHIIRAFFTKEGSYFIVASNSMLSIWRLNTPFSMSLVMHHKVSKIICDACPSLCEASVFYVCTNDTVISFTIDESKESAPLTESIVPSKRLLKMGKSSDSCESYSRVISHPTAPGKVFVISKFYDYALHGSSSLMGLPSSVESFLISRELHVAVCLADGRVHFSMPCDTPVKISHEFTALAVEHKTDLPLMAFLPMLPGYAVVIGHRSGAAYLVGPINASDELKYESIGNVEHTHSVTCVKASSKFLVTVSADEQLLKLWRLNMSKKSAKYELRLVGLLPFDCGKISDICFMADMSYTSDMLGGNDAGDRLILVDHLAVIRRYAIISNP